MQDFSCKTPEFLQKSDEAYKRQSALQQNAAQCTSQGMQAQHQYGAGVPITRDKSIVEMGIDQLFGSHSILAHAIGELIGALRPVSQPLGMEQAAKEVCEPSSCEIAQRISILRAKSDELAEQVRAAKSALCI
jgi:hypothetical protein